jgi:hypothetical protein
LTPEVILSTLRIFDGECAVANIVLILALLQMAGGALAALLATSTNHQILGATSFGLGVVSFALAAIIAKMDDFVKAWRGKPPV